MKKKRRVAVFDIDGTIFRSSLLIEITDALVARGIFPKKVRGQYEKARQRWLDRKSSYENYIRAVINAFDSNIAGIHYKTFKKIAREVTARRKDRVYRYTRDLVAGLNKKKYYLLAISHSPKGVADEFAKRLGFDKVYGRMLETDKDGVFTGKSMHAELIFDKAKVLRRAIEKENLTLRGSVGVGEIGRAHV